MDLTIPTGSQVMEATGNKLLSQLLNAPSVAKMANPYAAAAGALLSPDHVAATSASNGNRGEASIDNSGWNVNFGSGSITSSATREAISQWIGIAAGIVTVLVALKLLKR
ncbi:hypothetical protein RY831_27665 [Noviherbaspirillum sp. CPCC 100848]|uniref:Uncharacterized protein n=1 Tax=Noviherbaspirillum album TaxID=3080276 RepID=A0ABU6JH24_9BURK|nr:hypothetical protein [Noviherbaspirillum sp. CPCC 100848]MEC4722942.1 hypothetical protein [Noviherbaspirillum sp. CPCC 100848]